MKELVAPPENVFRRIVEDATDFSILLLDREGRILMWNAGAEAIFGYPRDEVIGRPFEFLFTAEDREHGVPQKELATAREHGRADDTRWHVGKDGRSSLRRFVSASCAARRRSVRWRSVMSRPNFE